MSKTLDPNQAAKIFRTYLEPLYLAHIYLPGETLYLSNRSFKYNGHQYEALLLDLPALAQSIEKLGGYQNLSGSLNFRNVRYRSAAAFLDWLNANPITRREMDLRVLYINPGEVFGSDVSTHLARLAIGEIQGATDSSIVCGVSSIMHFLDNKSPFTQINRTDWPDAAPDAIGKYANKIYGFIRDVPCHCVVTGAVSTLFFNLAATGETYVTLSEVDWPIAFPASGTVLIDNEKITYSAKDSVNKRLTISGRGTGGTAATVHSRGAPVWLVVGTYKYLVADHACKSAGNVKTAGIRINPSDYAVDLNDGGKTTISFSAPQMLKVQGMHFHPMEVPSTVTKYGIAAGNSGDGHWTIVGSADYMRDRDLNTSQWMYNNTVFHCQGIQYVDFQPVAGTISDITVYIKHTGHPYNAYSANWVHLRIWQGGNVEDKGQLDYSGSTVTQSFKPFNLISIDRVDVVMNKGMDGYAVQETVFEIYIVYSLTSGGPGSGADGVWGSPEDVINPPITCDVEGYPDDGSGTYTGTPNALIEVPSDVRKHLLIAQYGRSAGEIGASFATARTAYVNRIAGGYKFGTILSRLGTKPSEIFKAFDEQSRSNMREDGGKFELVFNDAASPTSVLTIDKKIYVGTPIFRQTRTEDIKNLIRAKYDIDWSGTSGGRKYGDYRRQTQRSNGASITKYGELALDLEYPAIQVPAMADDVADWALLQQKDVVWSVELVANRKARILEKGDWFTLNDVFASLTGLKWRVLSIEEVPYSQNYNIQAVQYVAP